jgi:hypothetical protein
MERIITIFFAIIATFSSYSQTYIQDGDRCFDDSDYACAVTNYNNAFINATGKDRQIAEIKLTRAKWCAEHIKIANQAFAAKNYSAAKDEYQKVLDSNPKDSYAQSQIVKCDNALNVPKLRKATTADITDIWNNKYGVQPQRRQNLINAGIDPDDAQKRINAGEGKPQEKEEQATNLSVSKSTLYFTSDGENIEQIKVYSDAGTYSVPSAYVPMWCTVKTYSGYFTVTASPNPIFTSRKDWFKVTSGGKEVRINVEQFAKKSHNTQQPSSSNAKQLSSPNYQQSSSSKKQKTQSNISKCFNCPKTHDTWGLTLGYAQPTIGNYSMRGFQIGVKAEPLFKYGFGLNTGINFLGYSNKLFKSSFDAYAVNVPLHLEYRLNQSKWFNLLAYGGVGFNAITNRNFDNYSLPITFEYGGGFRISHVQFNAGSSLYLGNFRNSQNSFEFAETYPKLILSVSYMF